MNSNPGSKASVGAKLFWGLLFVLISLNVSIWITGYTYVYKTLVYTYPDIDDLSIFDSRKVTSKNPSEWPLAANYNKAKLPASTQDVLRRLESVAFLVIKNDSICYEEYWDHYSPNSLSNSFSVAKSIVGLLVGIAVDEGKLSLYDPVGKYLPDFAEGEDQRLRIHDLLSMSSALNWDESYSSLFSKTTEAYYGSNLNRLVKELRVKADPGKNFSYMSCNTLLLGIILEKVTGKKLSDYATEKLWTPLQATHPAFWSLDTENGTEKSYCCFYSNARDFARIGQLVLDSGSWKGQQVVSRKFLAEALKPNELTDSDGNKVNYYGLHWWMLDYKGHNVHYARGILGQYIISIPDQRIVIVRLGNKRGDKLPTQHYDDMMEYLHGVLATFGSH